MCPPVSIERLTHCVAHRNRIRFPHRVNPFHCFLRFNPNTLRLKASFTKLWISSTSLFSNCRLQGRFIASRAYWKPTDEFSRSYLSCFCVFIYRLFNMVASRSSPRACRFGTPPPYKYGGNPHTFALGAVLNFTDSQVMPSVRLCQGYTSASGVLDCRRPSRLFVANR